MKPAREKERLVQHSPEDTAMLRYAVIFLIIAIVVAIFHFGGIAGDAAWIAKILLVVFLILFVVSLVLGRRGPGV
jgi:uncharacterized membrane protein YtjA (UPF0391 family)